MTLTIVLLALAGAVIAAVVGTFWYSDKTPMGKLHMRYLGFDKLSDEEKKKMIAEAMPNMWKTYLAQMALSLLTSFAVVYIVKLSLQGGVSLSMAIGFTLFGWICYTVPTIGSAILWGNCDSKIAWQKFFSDIFCNLVTILLIGGMVSLFA